jgi:tRNA(Ile)-lysidine synthase
MINKILFLNEIRSRSEVFVACSGGLDSMVLVHLLKNLEIPICVLHCNFQLRGQDSNDDEDFVKSYCEKEKLPIRIKRFDTKELLKNENQSVQELARNLRYSWFDKILDSHPNAVICTAHHADDNEEQIWLRLLSSGRLLDLGGIPAQRKQYLRPLLQLSKSELRVYASENKLFWREDSSNAETNYTRNKIRLELKPLLNEIDPRHAKAISTLSKEIQQLRNDANEILFKHLGFKILDGEFFVSDEFWENQLSIVKEILLEFWCRSNAKLYEIERFYQDAKHGSKLSFKNEHYVIREINGLWFGNERLDQFNPLQINLDFYYEESSLEYRIKKDFNVLLECRHEPKEKYKTIEVKKPGSGELVLLRSGKKRKVKKIWNDEKWTYHQRKVVLGYYSENTLLFIFPMTQLKLGKHEQH